MSEGPYLVRVTRRASLQIEEQRNWLADAAGPDAAAAWAEGMADALASLATYPLRCPIADEDTVFKRTHPDETVRVRLFRPRRGGPTWRLLFTVQEATADDAPTVEILMVRHGAQAPLTEWPKEEP